MSLLTEASEVMRQAIAELDRLRTVNAGLLEAAGEIDDFYDDVLQGRLPDELRFKLKEAIAQAVKP